MSTSTATDRRSRAATRAVAALTLALLGNAASAGPACSTALILADDQSPPAVAPTPAPRAAASDGPAAPENVESLPPDEAASVLGKKVQGPKGEDLGLIVDVLIDSDGQPRAAVIDFGGFLGVGSRKIAIDWKALDFTSLGRGGIVELGLQRAQIAAAPEYKPGQSSAVVVVTAPPAPGPPVDVHK